MYFQVLQRRLVGTIRERVRNGELTERRLARLSGVSQPHMHNVLKGVRIFSPEFADQVLRQLKITVLDLCETGEAIPGQSLLNAAADGVCWVPKLAQELGPGRPWMDVEVSGGGACEDGHPFNSAAVAGLKEPCVGTLAEDARMLPRFRAGDTVLLDSAEHSRLHPEPHCAYIVNAPGGSLVRYVRQGGGRLYLVAEDGLDDRERWDCVSLADRHILDVVRARIVWMGRQMES